MLTIVCLAPYTFLPAKSGGQKNINLFYKYLGLYANIIAITTEGNKNKLASNYRTIPVFSNSAVRYINPFNILRLKKIIKAHRATHILIEHPYLGWQAIILSKICSVKLVVHSHNIEGLRFKSLNKWWWKLLLKYECFVHRQADYNLFIQQEDLEYALKKFNLKRYKCTILSYGIEQEAPPDLFEKLNAKKTICSKYGLNESSKIILFVGVFNYKPNLDAYRIIVDNINPNLHRIWSDYKIFICGPNLDSSLSTDNIIVTGYVDDISLFFKGADVFINPIRSGGGIKTKLVEALGYNTNAVSTKVGAIGINPNITNNKLFLIENENWQAFTDYIIHASNIIQNIPSEYYEYFSWRKSTKRIADFLADE